MGRNPHLSADGGHRPYSAPDQLYGATPRTGEFNTGQAGDDPGNAPTSAGQDAGLSLSSQQFNAKTPKAVVQTSVLQPSRPSMNGMSAQDYERVLPGLTKPLPSANGSSADTYQKSLIMRLQGQDEG
jgi:hypothetical protein